jgi:hypothetical protein
VPGHRRRGHSPSPPAWSAPQAAAHRTFGGGLPAHGLGSHHLLRGAYRRNLRHSFLASSDIIAGARLASPEVAGPSSGSARPIRLADRDYAGRSCISFAEPDLAGRPSPHVAPLLRHHPPTSRLMTAAVITTRNAATTRGSGSRSDAAQRGQRERSRPRGRRLRARDPRSHHDPRYLAARLTAHGRASRRLDAPVLRGAPLPGARADSSEDPRSGTVRGRPAKGAKSVARVPAAKVSDPMMRLNERGLVESQALRSGARPASLGLAPKSEVRI